MVEITYIGKCLLVEEEGKKILAVGDLHLGYEEALNRAGVYVTRKLFEEMIQNFEGIFSRISKGGKKVDEIVLLGDVKHVFGSVLRQEWDDVSALLWYFLEKKKVRSVVIVKGNHDVSLEPVVRKMKSVELREFYCIGGVCFVHGNRDFPEMYDGGVKMWVMGHGHPALVLREGVKREKYKCFLEGKWKGRKVVIVPSFSEHGEGSDPREHWLGLAWEFPLGKFRAWVVGEKGEVLDFGRVGKVKG